MRTITHKCVFLQPRWERRSFLNDSSVQVQPALSTQSIPEFLPLVNRELTVYSYLTVLIIKQQQNSKNPNDWEWVQVGTPHMRTLHSGPAVLILSHVLLQDSSFLRTLMDGWYCLNMQNLAQVFKYLVCLTAKAEPITEKWREILTWSWFRM